MLTSARVPRHILKQQVHAITVVIAGDYRKAGHA
jgi:hypothetical protein